MAGSPKVTPYLLYRDVSAALAWLSEAFGFSERLRFADDEGVVSHAEMEIGAEGLVMLGHPGPDYRNPDELGSLHALVHVYVEDVDDHFARAKEAGARIRSEPADQPYGDRRYDCVDPEGQMWSFAQKVRDVAPEEWGAQTSTSA